MRKDVLKILSILLVLLLFSVSCGVFVSAQGDSPILDIIFIEPFRTGIIPVSDVVVPSSNFSTVTVGLAVTLRIPSGMLLYPDDGFRSTDSHIVWMSNVARVDQADGTTLRRFSIDVRVDNSVNYPLIIDLVYNCKFKINLNSSLYDPYEKQITLTVLSPGSTPVPYQTPEPTTPTPSVTVTPTSSATFTPSPSWGTPTPTLTPTPYADYWVSTNAGEGGRISGGSGFAYEGESCTITITPDEGYEIADVTDNGVSKGAISVYRIYDIHENHQVAATFRLIDNSVPTNPTNNSNTSSIDIMSLVIILIIVIIVLIVVIAVLALRRRGKQNFYYPPPPPSS